MDLVGVMIVTMVLCIELQRLGKMDSGGMDGGMKVRIAALTHEIGLGE